MTELAGIYTRLSVARYGDSTKVADQEQISRANCSAQGWKLAEGVGYPLPNGVYCDNSRSAWQRNRKRPAWDQMLADVEAGRITAIVVYHGDRLVRQPYDLELLLNLADARGIRLASPTGVRDLGESQDRTMLRVLTAFRCGESDDTSRRKKDGFARMARQGIAPSAGGRYGRGFGYDSAGRVQVEAEAAALREAAQRVLAGEHLSGIAASLDERGIRSVSGKPLSYASLRTILTRPRVAGLMADGSAGSWEPILDRGTWELTCAILDGRSATRPAPSQARYLLSGIARCSCCGAGLQRQSSGPRGRTVLGYACVAPGCRRVRRNMEQLDRYVTSAVIARLANPANPAPRDRPGPQAGQLRALSAARAEAEAAVADPAHSGRLPLLLARLDAIDGRMGELRGKLAGDAASRLRSRHQGMTLEQFRAEPLATRRTIVSSSVSVVVLPASRRGPGFREQDVTVTAR